METKSTSSQSSKSAADQTVKNIRRATRKVYSAEEKIRIVLEGLSRKTSTAVTLSIDTNILKTVSFIS